MKAIGRRRWAIAGGHIPLRSTGPEPALVSHETLCLLNAGERDASVELWIHHPGREPVGPYRMKVGARRVRHVRFNDLIDPEALFLGADYGAAIEADVPIVVQFTRLDTSRAANAQCGTLAHPCDEA